MSFGLEFNRKIDRNVDYISPGGYEFETNSTTLQFDFLDYEGTIDNNVLSVEHYNLDGDYCDSARVTVDDLKAISKINEFFVYIDREDESEDYLEVVAIRNLEFFTRNGKVEHTIRVPEKVLCEYNRLLNSIRKGANVTV